MDRNAYSAVVGVILMVGITLAIAATVYVVVSDHYDDCYKSMVYSGYLTGWETYPTTLAFVNDTFYVTDWWTVNNYAPGNIEQFFNHSVEIKYTGGCGRVLVNGIEIIGGH